MASIDETTRRIAEKRIEPGNEFADYQEAQNQLLAINAEQQQRLALHQQNAASMMGQTQLLGQAAEVMNVNPETQQILSNYGVAQPRSIKSSEIRRQGPTTITINNNTVNNTQGPVQGRDLRISPQAENQSKFKAWLSGVFARQDAQWKLQSREYERQQSDLSRSSNKMMRKIETLGKEIGKAVDPRRIAQSVSNPAMNLIKSLGLLVLAKRIPKILKFFDNVESTIRKWVGKIRENGGIKETIKNLIYGKGGRGGLLGRGGVLSKAIYNDQKTGILNRFEEWISEQLDKRTEAAKKAAGEMPNLLKNGKWGIKPWLTWVGNFLQGFLGGSATKIQSKVEESDAASDATTSDNTVSSAQGGWRDRAGFDLRGNFKAHGENRFGISSSTGKEFSQKDYENWLKKNNKKEGDISLREYLDEHDFAYTGEAIILTERVYKSTKRVLNTDYDLKGTTLVSGSYYPMLALSHDVIAEFKRGRKNGMRHILIFLKILYNSCRGISAGGFHTEGGVLVFPEMLSKVASPKLIEELKKSKQGGGTPDISSIKICLHKSKMSEKDKHMYSSYGKAGSVGKGALGGAAASTVAGVINIGAAVVTGLATGGKVASRGLATYFKKINTLEGQRKYSQGNDQARELLTLNERDFNGQTGKTTWTVYRVSKEGMGRILQDLSGFGTREMDLSERSQLHAQEYLAKLSANLNDVKTIQRWKTEKTENLEDAYLFDEEQREKRAQYEAERSGNNYQGGGGFFEDSSRTGEYTGDAINDSKGVNMGEGNVSRLGRGHYIPNVTRIFGGTGTLTSNYNELRDYDGQGKPVTSRTPNNIIVNGKYMRRHRGVDIAYNGGGVFYPLTGGVVKDVDLSKGRIDIDNQDGTFTRYWHMKSSTYKVGDQVIPQQSIGDTGNHIHVEVRRNDQTAINPLTYFKGKGKSINAQESSLVPSNSWAVPTGGPSYEEEISSAFKAGILSKEKIPFSRRDKEASEQVDLSSIEIIAAQILESNTYLANAIKPLSEIIDSGFTKVAKSNKTASTPEKPQVGNIQTKRL